MSRQETETEQFERRLAWESRTVFERASVYERSDAVETDGSAQRAADAFFDEWCERVFDGDREVLDRRLEAAPVSEAVCRASFGVDAWPGDVAVPEWTDAIAALVAAAGDHDRAVPEHARDDPFAHAVAPWVEWAWQDVSAEQSFRRFSESAVNALKEWLLRRFVELCSDPLYVEFRTFVSTRRPTLFFSGPPEDGDPTTDLYDEFTAALSDPDRLRAFFADYPVLARWVATTVRQWQDAVAEFHRDLDSDWDALVETFAPAADPETVRGVSPNEGDRHHDGRAVVEVALTEETTVFYKPRDVDPERVLYSFFRRVADELDRTASVPTCLSRSGYGWVEEIEPADGEHADVGAYFERAGVLLCVAQVVGLSDCHYQNVVATDDHPAVVDAETLVHPILGVREEPRSSLWPHTVVQTGLLPGSVDDDDGDAIAGLVPPEVTPDAVFTGAGPSWKYPNTDWMTPREDLEDPDAAEVETNNVPVRDGEPVGLEAHVSEVEAGFTDAYRLLLDDDSLLDDLADELEGLRTRVLYAATSSYAQVRNALTSPDCAEDGTAVTLELETLTSGIGEDEVDADAVLDFHRAERTALKRLDVPRFDADTTGTDVYFDDRSLGSLVDTTGFERFRNRLDSLARDGLGMQRDLIRFSLDPECVPALERRDEPLAVEAPDRTALAGSRVEEAVDELYRRCRAERRTSNGEPVWRDPGVDVDVSIDAEGDVVSPADEDGKLSLSVTEDGLYDGRGGIALFFAAAHAVLDVAGAREAALTTVEPMRQRLRDGEQTTEVVGVGSGAGAQVYALTVAGDLLDEPALFEDARLAAEAITDDRIAEDELYDVVGGSAGAVLALLALADRTGDRWAVDRAVRCGERLLDGRVETDTDYRAWPATTAKWPLTGFAHGAAGNGYALYRLAEASGEDRFRTAGREALAYEDALYDDAERNWPDRREDDGYMDAWCHGRAGIVLSRLGVRRLAGRTPFLDDLAPIADRIGDDRDLQQQLCCGAAGRAVVLDEVGRALGEDRYVERAHGEMEGVLRTADEVGSFLIPFHTSHVYKPGLFMGTTGLGYALLRLRDRSATPNVLLFE